MSSFSDVLLKRIATERNAVVDRVSEGYDLTDRERVGLVSRNLTLKWVEEQIADVKRLDNDNPEVNEDEHGQDDEPKKTPRRPRRRARPWGAG
jgi:hypothetical protein